MPETLARRWSSQNIATFDMKTKVTQIRTLTGQLVQPIGSVSLELTLNANKIKWNALVLKDPGSPLLFGLDFLTEFGVEINIGQNFIQSPHFGCIPTLSNGRSPGLKDFDHDAYIKTHDPLKNREDLAPEEISKLRDVLYKYKTAFSSKPGSTTAYYHTIDTGDAKPVNSRPHTVSSYKKPNMRELINGLLKDGIIVESNSQWNNPVTLINVNPQDKGGKSHRFCLDCRNLNKKIQKAEYPMLTTEEVLNTIHSPKYVSTFDLASGYFQVPLRPDHAHKTAFRCPYGVFHFTKMVMGEKNASFGFTKCMKKILPKMEEYGILVYLDDLFLASDTFEHHLRGIEYILSCISAAGLTIRIEKSTIAKPSAKILGFLVDAEGVRVDPSKTESITQYEPPKTVKQLRRFLGMANFLRRFIKNFATIAEPLTRLLKNKCRWQWESEQEDAFNELKKRLTEAPVLSTPSPDGHFTLATDASNFGIGGCLLQEQQGQDKVIAYYSRTLSQIERKYSASHREAIAAADSMTRFRAYLEGIPFTLVSDNTALSVLHKSPDVYGCLGRLSLRLQNFDFVMKYRPGRENHMPDFLSRVDEPKECEINTNEEETSDCIITDRRESKEKIISSSPFALPPLTETTPPQNSDNDTSENSPLCFIALEEATTRSEPITSESLTSETSADRSNLIRAQKEDPLTKDIYSFLCETEPATSKVNKRLKQKSKNFCIENEILMRCDKSGNKIVIPQIFKERIMQFLHCHKLSGHFGVKRSTERIVRHYFWQGMHKEIKDFIKACTVCAQYKPQVGKQKGHMQSQMHTRPWQHVYVDFLGPLVRSTKGNKYLLVFQDGFTRAIELAAVREATAQVVAKKLVEIVVCRHGVMDCLYSDNGPSFRASVYKETCRLLEIDVRTTIPYHPASNRVERGNQDLVKLIAIAAQNRHTTWDASLSEIQFSFNTAVNRSTGYSPFFLNHFRDPQLPVLMTNEFIPANDTELNRDIPDYVKHLSSTVPVIFQETKDNMAKATEIYAKHYNKTRSAEEYETGILVYDKTHFLSNAANQFTKKLAPRYIGPFIITKKFSPVAYEISDTATNKVIGKRHITQLKRYYNFDSNNKIIKPNTSGDKIHTNKTSPKETMSGTMVTKLPTAQNQLRTVDELKEAEGATGSVTNGHKKCAASWCTFPDHQPTISCTMCKQNFHKICASVFDESCSTFLCATCR